MPDWKQRAASLEPPLPPEAAEALTARLNTLSTEFAKIKARLQPTDDPDVIFHAESEAE
jgi:hypothetical protein